MRTFERLSSFSLIWLAALSLAATPPATQQSLTDQKIQLFRFRAIAGAELYRSTAERLDFAGKEKAELISLVDEYVKRMEAEIEGIRQTPPPLEQLNLLADQLQGDFNEHKLSPWLLEHEAFVQALHRQLSINEIIGAAVRWAPEMLIAAVKETGADADSIETTQRLITESRDEMTRFDEELQKRQQQIAKLPPGEEKAVAEAVVMADIQTQLVRSVETITGQLREALSLAQQNRLEENLIEMDIPMEPG